MPRSVAASTMQAVLGPRHSESAMIAQARDRGGHIEGAILDRRHHQIAGGIQAGAADFFMARPHHDLVHAARRGLARLAEAALHAGQILQLERDMLEDVARPGAFAQAQQKSAMLTDAAAVLDQRGQPGRTGVRKNRGWCWKANPPARQYPPTLQEPDDKSRYSVHAET